MKRSFVPVGFRTIASLTLCAAAAGAALAHAAIDVIGDYVLPRDSYDYLQHGSRELVTGLALLVAMLVALQGLRSCCEIAATNRSRLLRPALRLRDALGLIAGAAAASALLVPGMEYLDGRIDGTAVRGLSDAFGGSIALGLGTTLVCASFVALVVYGMARWLISHRDTIAQIVETLLRVRASACRPNRHDLIAQLVTPRRRRAPHALRLCKRGPPLGGRCQPHHAHLTTQGDSHEFRSFIAEAERSKRTARGPVSSCRMRRSRLRFRSGRRQRLGSRP
jgi:hypothetical protein